MSLYEVDNNKSYSISSNTKVIHYNDKYLVIVPETANWIVLDSSKQLAVIDFFKRGKTIDQALKNLDFDKNDVTYVVSQLEGRKLCSKKVHDSIEEERSMHLYLTNKCNLSCPHCYMYSGIANENELTIEELIKLIKNYRIIANGKRITISGGEPAIHPDFDFIIEYASNIGLEIKILTNGVSFTPERIRKIARYIDSVQISIDGFSEESDAIIRGKEHFHKALSTVDFFVNEGVKTSVAITPDFNILKENPEKFVKFAKVLSQKYIDKEFCVKFTDKLSQGRFINLSNEQNQMYSTLVKQIQKSIYDFDYDFVNFVNTIGNGIITKNCMFGVFSVASNGDVYLCPEIGKLKPIANIRTIPFEDIYQRSLAAEEATSILKIKPCNECELKFICGGGCRIEEFPDIPKVKSFTNIGKGTFFSRECNSKIKEKFYDLMIRSNEYLYI